MSVTIIAVDFDGTIVEHCYPAIGAEVPGAFEWLKKFQELSARLILWTMRSDERLAAAVEFCRQNGVEFWGVNRNPEQHVWTESPKAYAHYYIDDAAFGCPVLDNPNGRPYVDWSVVVARQLSRLLAENSGTTTPA